MCNHLYNYNIYFTMGKARIQNYIYPKGLISHNRKAPMGYGILGMEIIPYSKQAS